jgi:hypothetical protein
METNGTRTDRRHRPETLIRFSRGIVASAAEAAGLGRLVVNRRWAHGQC